MGFDVSAGSLPVTYELSGLTPLPASGLHQLGYPVAEHSVCCWAPYFATENPQRRVRSIGVQPMRGTVINASPPAARISSMNVSADDPSGSPAGFATSFA